VDRAAGVALQEGRRGYRGPEDLVPASREHLREPVKGLVKELLKNDMEPIDAVNW
jgi:hypothetical protein